MTAAAFGVVVIWSVIFDDALLSRRNVRVPSSIWSVISNDALLSRFGAWSRDSAEAQMSNPIENLKCLHEVHRHFCGLPGLVEVDDEVH